MDDVKKLVPIQPPMVTEPEAVELLRQLGIAEVYVGDASKVRAWGDKLVMRGWDAAALMSSEPEASALEMARAALLKTRSRRSAAGDIDTMHIDQCVTAMVQRLEEDKEEIDWLKRASGYQDLSYESPATVAANEILVALADAINGRSGGKSKLGKRRKQLAKALGMGTDAPWEWLLARAAELAEERNES